MGCRNMCWYVTFKGDANTTIDKTVVVEKTVCHEVMPKKIDIVRSTAYNKKVKKVKKTKDIKIS